MSKEKREVFRSYLLRQDADRSDGLIVYRKYTILIFGGMVDISCFLNDASLLHDALSGAGAEMCLKGVSTRMVSEIRYISMR